MRLTLPTPTLPAKCSALAALLLAVLSLMACRSTGPTRAAARAVIVPLLLEGQHTAIEVHINGQVAKLVLDTGADQNVLTPAAAARLGLQPGKEQVSGQGASAGYGPVPWVVIEELSVGALRQRPHAAFIVPLPKEFTADGVLGTPFFKEFVVSMDRQRGELTLQLPKTFVSSVGAAPIPITLDAGKLVVSATAAGITGQFTIDTGAGNALTFFSPAVASHGLQAALSPPVRGALTGASAGGYTYGDLARVPELIIGPYRLTQVVTGLSSAQNGLFASPRYLGNIGAEVWRRFAVTLDYGAGRMYLEPNSSYHDPFIPPRSGLSVAFRDGALTVIDVMAGSPAAENGIQVGDRISRLDGVTVSETDVPAARMALRGAPGTRVALGLLNGQAAQREATLTLRDLL